VHAALLMDIRDVLQRMNEKLSVLQCVNFLRIPAKLDSIKKNTTRKKPQPTKGRKRS